MPGISLVSLGAAITTLILAASPFQQGLEPAPKPRESPADMTATVPLEYRFGEKCTNGEEPPETVTPGPKHTPARQDPSHPFTRSEYPPGARIRGEEGTAVMLMLVNEKGRIVRARIDRSTGSKALDEAALKTSRDWQVIPATDQGKPICGWARFAMTFRLEGGAPDLTAVRLLPSAEHAFELMSGDQLLQWVVDLSGKPGARGAAPDLADEVMRAKTRDFEQVKHDGEAILSLAFNEDELQEIIRILESPVGMRFFRLQPVLVNQFYFTFNPVVRRAGCSVMLLKSSLDAGVAAKGIGGSGLPPAFRDVIPALVQESSEFCTCAARQPAWSETFRTGEDPLAFVRRACGKPPELKW